MIKVSVIVPVYNAEETITRCVNSVLGQTFTDFELLLINDGSEDRSLELLQEFSKKDGRITVLTQENKGAGIARNNGLDHAVGDFVTFLDSDDAFEPEYLAVLVSASDGADAVCCGYKKYKVNDDGTKVLIVERKPVDNPWMEFKFTCTVGKLYRRDLLEKNKLRFHDFAISEDVLFTLSALSRAEKLCIVTYSGYMNYHNSSSATATKRVIDILPVLQSIDRNVNLSKYPADMLTFFYYKTIIQNVIMQLDVLPTKELKATYLENYCWFKGILKTHGWKNKLYWQQAEETSINLLCNVFKMTTWLHCTRVLMFLLKKAKFIRMA